MSRALAPILVLVLSCTVTAQLQIEPQGNFHIQTTPAVLGETFTLTLTGSPFASYILVTDSFPGSIAFPPFGNLWLALTPNANVAADSFPGGNAPVLSINGDLVTSTAIPLLPALDGFALFLQGFGADPASPTGFAFSNAKSLLFMLPDTYKASLDMTEPRAFAEVAPLPNGSYLVIGGGNGQLLLPAARPTVERYNPYLRSFAPDQPMAVERTLHQATVLQDDRVLVSGGSMTLGVGVPSAEIYDPATSNWSAPILMTETRIAHTATLLPDGRVLIAGGASTFVLTPPTSTNRLPIFQAALDTAEIFDPATNTFTATMNKMSLARLGHAATLLANGKVLLSGGIRDGQLILGTGAPLYAAGCDVFDPTTNSFSPAAAMAVPRVVHTQERLPNGRVIAIAGAGGTFVSTVGSTEIYDPVADAWTLGPPLPSAATLALHTTTVLFDGSLYVAGGAVGAVGTFQGRDGAYRYDAISGWSSLGPLDAARQAHVAIDTPEGVFLIGGADAGNPVGMPPVPSTALKTAVYWAPF